MGSQTAHKIPVVDFTNENLKPGSDSWALACKQVRYGLEEYGCFEVVYNKVPTELHNSIFSSAEELFALPIETKRQKTSDRPGSNYVGQNPYLPLYESMGLDNPTILEAAECFTRHMWPQGNDIFRESVRSFSKPVVELYGMAAKMVFDSFGLERLYDPLMELTFYRLRFFKYAAPKMDETNIGLKTHTDKTFMTVLHQHQVDGLQIRTKDDQFIEVKPNFSSFLFLAGDAFMAWTNDRVRACEHRVILKDYKERYSLGFYSLINGVIHVPEELIDEDSPLRYKPIDHMNFLTQFFTDDAIRYSACPIKTFAGL